jgi:hypothetical protein
MKKLFLALAIAAALLSGCGNDKTIDGKYYDVYGLANEEANKDPNIVYEMSPVSVIVAIIFIETIFVPVYVIGWDLYQPVRKRDAK